MRDDLISRQAAIDVAKQHWYKPDIAKALEDLPSAQPERLTDDDFETIRIHLNAYKEKLCNQHRWKEAEEYQRIIDRFMEFASQPTIKPRKGKWIYRREYGTAKVWTCSECGWNDIGEWNFCPNCGADMRQEEEQ